MMFGVSVQEWGFKQAMNCFRFTEGKGRITQWVVTLRQAMFVVSQPGCYELVVLGKGPECSPHEPVLSVF